MKNNLILPLIVLIVGGIAVYYFTKNSPDVRYTLSDSIPVSFLNPNGNPEIIQQLKVQNVGSETAKDIRVKIKGEITSNKLDKYSNADKEEIYNQSGNFELAYPELPPQASFTLTLKSQGGDINKSNLSVSYNLGLAQEAFVKRSSTTDFSNLILFSTYIICALFFIYVIIKSSKEFSLKHSTIPEILKKKSPWYLRQVKYQKMFDEAVNYRISRDFILPDNLSASESYNLLAADRPDYIDDDIWNKLLEKATGKLKDIYSYRLNNIYDSNKLLEFLKQEKPKHLSDFVWAELQDKGEEIYCEIKKRRTRNVEELIMTLKSQKIHEIGEEKLNALISDLRRKLVDELEHKIFMSDTPYSYIINLDLSVLDDESLSTLKKSAYRSQFDKYNSIITVEDAKKIQSIVKPTWIKESDYASIQRRAKKIIEIEEKDTDSQKMQEEYKAKLNDLSKDREKLDNQVEEVLELKQKIENQLQIVDIVVNEPEKIERIEDYSHSFALGNFENLKKLAELNKKPSANNPN